MNTYESKQESRRQRLENLADRMQAASDAAYQQARRMADVIPMGQPIMVGHHSEKRDRAYRAKIWRTQDRCLELQRKAKYFREKATSVGLGGISSDDENATDKLADKLASLEHLQERMKAINTAHSRFMKDPASLEKSSLSDDDKNRIRNYKPAYSWEPHPFAPYQLTNNNANIRRIKERIASLSNRPTETTEREVGSVTVREDAEDNRLWMVFQGKPTDDVRSCLKQHGFRWSPDRGAWVRKLNNGARFAAECVLNKIQAA